MNECNTSIQHWLNGLYDYGYLVVMPVLYTSYYLCPVFWLLYFTGLQCPSGWRENAGYCYYVSSEHAQSQQAAQTECENMNANLVSITSHAETLFLKA